MDLLLLNFLLLCGGKCLLGRSVGVLREEERLRGKIREGEVHHRIETVVLRLEGLRECVHGRHGRHGVVERYDVLGRSAVEWVELCGVVVALLLVVALLEDLAAVEELLEVRRNNKSGRGIPEVLTDPLFLDVTVWVGEGVAARSGGCVHLLVFEGLGVSVELYLELGHVLVLVGGHRNEVRDGEAHGELDDALGRGVVEAGVDDVEDDAVLVEAVDDGPLVVVRGVGVAGVGGGPVGEADGVEVDGPGGPVGAVVGGVGVLEVGELASRLVRFAA